MIDHQRKEGGVSPTASVTVVVPCYNVAACVGRAVASALAQTDPPTEVICVDDGSTDGTLAVLRDLEASHPEGIRVLTGPNGGAPSARNRGLAEARGTYVQFLDADDELYPDKLGTQAALAERTGADFVAGGYRRVRGGAEEHRTEPDGGSPWVALLRGRLGITSANLWRRTAIKAIGGWDEDWPSSQEADLMARLLKAGAVVAIDPAVRTTLHARAGSISDAFDGPLRERYVRVRADALAYWETHAVPGLEDLGAAREAVFNSVRALYTQDREAALRYYRRALPSGYCPPVSGHNTRPYVRACRLLGFDFAERLRALRKGS